ncbi:hypothetical protein BKA69DRAFT_1031170 [Paraphysoderma sedebokerense]|nr:hypothetical protein BKA69DRAFT_1031170 [Paraphysoderma sedebokerense]
MKEYLNRLIVAPRWRNRDTVEPKSTGSISAFTRQQQESDSESLKKDFAHFVNLIQSFILNRLIRGYNNETDSEDDEDEEADRFKGRPNKDEAVMNATRVLGIFYKLNEVYNYLPYTEFQNATLSSCLDIKKDFPKYRTQEFSYCQYPFIITTEVKADILKIECMVTMRHELQDAFFRSMFIGVNSPYCVLKVRREWVVRDAMAQLEQMSSQDLKKQLKVAFIGEAGVDEGGVQKEFFQIVVRDMFDEKYGMFTYNPQARTHWFTPNSVHDELSLNEYKLVGRLIGLAIYNSVLMDVKFPIVLYKKLLLNMNELSEVDPDLARGLQTLLDYPGDVQELYDRTFEVEYDCLGARLTAELKPGGSKISLTNENRKEFVQLYCDFILNTSIKEQFQSFKDGFDLVTGGSVIHLFRPEELEILVCGSSSLNFEDLEDVTQYDGGYTENTPVIKSFWKIVHSFSVEEKKRLLAFATGSDRSPIGGLSRLQFVIAKNGDDSDRLPTSHTCFNVLLLPEYKSEDKLRERLLTAIQNAEGFGLL